LGQLGGQQVKKLAHRLQAGIWRCANSYFPERAGWDAGVSSQLLKLATLQAF
jgi:hypothetical protein